LVAIGFFLQCGHAPFENRR